MPRRTKEEADITRQTVLRAALQVFSQQGYSATRLEDVAEKAGVTRGAIYHHFGNKADLYIEMSVEYSKPLGHIIEESIAEGGTIIDILRRQFILICAAMEDVPDLRAIQEIMLIKTEASDELLEGMIQKSENISQSLVQLESGFADALAQGHVRADLNIEELARAYLAYLNGYISLWLVAPKSFSIKKSAPLAIDIFFKGILP
jgi:AcrR family transcriptional regulator